MTRPAHAGQVEFYLYINKSVSYQTFTCMDVQRALSVGQRGIQIIQRALSFGQSGIQSVDINEVIASREVTYIYGQLKCPALPLKFLKIEFNKNLFFCRKKIFQTKLYPSFSGGYKGGYWGYFPPQNPGGKFPPQNPGGKYPPQNPRGNYPPPQNLEGNYP